MKRFTSIFFVSLLLSVVIFTSSCNSSPSTVQSVVTCFGDIGVKVIASVMSDTEPLEVADLLTVAPGCINAAIAAFSSPSNPTPSTPVVDINTSSTDGTATGTVLSNEWSNCTYYPQNLVFNFIVPFEMFVGASPDQGEFNASPGGTTDNELIAQQVFQQNGSYIASITSPGPSQSIVLTVPAETQVRLHLPIQLSYREGEARVIHTDGSTTSQPWLFTNGYQQADRITADASSC